MKTILTSSMMKKCDYNTINHFGIASKVLMERASLAVASEVLDRAVKGDKVLVFVGSGNNAADGVCTARILHNKGVSVALLMCAASDKYSDDLKEQLLIADRYGIARADEESIDDYDILIDAMLGIGITRPVKGQYAKLIEAYNGADAIKIAIDIPSGVNTDTGSASIACHVDATVTFNYKKPAHLIYPGRDYCGEVITADIGISEYSFLDDIKPNLYSAEPGDIKPLIRKDTDTNKGDYGKVLIIAGSTNMCGAAYLSAKAALHTGAGLVKVYTVSDNASVILSTLPECLVSTYDKYDEDKLRKELEWSSECVIGPGLGMSDTASSIVRYVLAHYDKPLIIDADAINIISQDDSLLRGTSGRIITPHLGEMSRLIGISIDDIKKDLINIARDCSKRYKVTVALKCASSVTALESGDAYINHSGNSGMSTAGSGDVLTGIIAGLIANHISADMACVLGVYIHGLCADYAADKTNKNYIIASDIIDAVAYVLQEEYHEY